MLRCRPGVVHAHRVPNSNSNSGSSASCCVRSSVTAQGPCVGVPRPVISFASVTSSYCSTAWPCTKHHISGRRPPHIIMLPMGSPPASTDHPLLGRHAGRPAAQPGSSSSAPRSIMPPILQRQQLLHSCCLDMQHCNNLCAPLKAREEASKPPPAVWRRQRNSQGPRHRLLPS